MYNFKIALFIIIFISLTVGYAIAGTILLMQIGAPTGGAPPPVCTNKLDFSQACNSQYIPVVF